MGGRSLHGQEQAARPSVLPLELSVTGSFCVLRSRVWFSALPIRCCSTQLAPSWPQPPTGMKLKFRRRQSLETA